MKGRKKILIVEDVPLNLELVIQLLEDDYDITTARDGLQAVEVTRKEIPDLILMDISLPKMNGIDATRQIKSDPVLSHIPVIGLSAHAMDGDAQDAMDAGLDDYITKPLDEDELFIKVKNYLGVPPSTR